VLGPAPYPGVITITFGRLILQKPEFTNEVNAFFPGVNNGDKSGKTPLHTAILSKQLRIVDRLLECGADVTIKDDAGDTALHTAIRVGSEKLVLVSVRSNISWKLRPGSHSLHDDVITCVGNVNTDINT